MQRQGDAHSPGARVDAGRLYFGHCYRSGVEAHMRYSDRTDSDSGKVGNLQGRVIVLEKSQPQRHVPYERAGHARVARRHRYGAVKCNRLVGLTAMVKAALVILPLLRRNTRLILSFNLPDLCGNGFMAYVAPLSIVVLLVLHLRSQTGDLVLY